MLSSGAFMLIVDRYVFRNVAIAAVFVIAVLAVLVLLTQSLRFLEFVINSGASGFMFWALTLLTLPKFFEVILPIGLMASAVFVHPSFKRLFTCSVNFTSSLE